MLALPTKKLLADVANFYNERPYIALLHKIKTSGVRPPSVIASDIRFFV